MFYSKNYRESFFFNLSISSLIITLARDKYSIGCHCGFSMKPWFCSRSAPNPSELASIFNLVGKFRSKIFRMGGDVSKFLSFQ